MMRLASGGLRAGVWIGLAGVFAGLFGCDDAPANGPVRAVQDPVVVALAPSQTRSVEQTIELVGTLFGDEEATISAKANGRVARTLKDVGDHVEAGEPLAVIDPVDYELAVAQRRAALEATLAELGLDAVPDDGFDLRTVPTVRRAAVEARNAEARLERGRTLFEQKPPRLSEQDFADLETAAQVAAAGVEVALLEAASTLAEARTRSAELAQAEQTLADTIVRAPADPGGQPREFAVAARLISAGEYVTTGTPVFRVVDADPIKFRGAVPERFSGRIAAGQRVIVRLDASGDPAEGMVARVSPTVDPASRTFQIEAHVPNSDWTLRPGAFANAQVVTGAREGVVFVPEAAVVTFAGQSRVFTVAAGKAVEHRIRTGARSDGHVEVVSGLERAADVVVSGVGQLADGAPVVVRAEQEQPATPGGALNRGPAGAGG